REWGEGWGKLVAVWLELERAKGFEADGGKLGNISQPGEVSKFIRDGRKWYQPPPVKNMGEVGEAGSFADEWWTWWSLQPQERKWCEETKTLSRPEKLTWGTLPKMHGRIGVMLVLATLLWWGLAERGEEGHGQSSVAWTNGVEDVTYLLGALV
ncbi:hypothetical protein DFH06DRAFT_937519, partial [Mycena polygramma]